MGTNPGFFELIFTFLIALYVSAQFSDADNEVCMSPNRRSGKCLNIKSCPDLLNLLQQKPLTESTIKFLQQSQCGLDSNRDPKVCCTNSYNQYNSSRLLDDTNSEPINVKNHPNLRLLGGDIQCARPSMQKVVGGLTANLDDYPWMALIGYRDSRRLISQTEFKCGGSIINKRYILTAAHCVANLSPVGDLYGVRVGEYDLSTEKDCMNFRCVTYQDFLVESYDYHPKYSTTTFVNDIALIRVDRDIDLTVDNAKQICLPIGIEPRKGLELTVAGWGKTENTRKRTTVLMKVSLPHFPQKECVKFYKLAGKPVTPKQMCYGGEVGKDSCQGDSGGPLFSASYSLYYVQYRIVSYGPGQCGKNPMPAVYTRVDQYLDWILDKLRD